MALGFKIKNFWVDLTGKCTALGGFVGSSIAGKINTYTADGAISSDYDIVELDASSATCQMTLADPTVSGRRIIISCYDATSTCDVDATFYTGDATGTFTGGDTLELVSFYSSSAAGFYWMVTGNEGVIFS